MKRSSQDLCVISSGERFSFELTPFFSGNLSLFPFLYLQADYNVIKRIDSGALRFLFKLRVLILNDNLIPVLPAHLFRLDSNYFAAKLLNYAASNL